MALVRFDNVSVRFPIYDASSRSLRRQLTRLAVGGRLDKGDGRRPIINALENVSFELQDGDSIGIVGHNGAGKSTLIRTIAGIYAPTEGSVLCEGRVSTVFELGAGIDHELTGVENIVRMGMLHGLSLDEAKAAIPEIDDFAELGDYLHIPVRTYSSGMVMRLMFSVATAMRPEILLIDEVFGTGDRAFKKKASERIKQLIESAKIFVFASHSEEQIQRNCARVIRLEHGRVLESGAN